MILTASEFAENEDETVLNAPEILRLAALKSNDWLVNLMSVDALVKIVLISNVCMKILVKLDILVSTALAEIFCLLNLKMLYRFPVTIFDVNVCEIVFTTPDNLEENVEVENDCINILPSAAIRAVNVFVEND